MDLCLKTHILDETKCRFIKKCGEGYTRRNKKCLKDCKFGYIRNEKTNRCRKNEFKTKSVKEFLPSNKKTSKTGYKSSNNLSNNLSKKCDRLFPCNSELNKDGYIHFKDNKGIMLAENLFDKDKNIKKKLLKNDFPRGWYVSEKYDGVRAIWTGKELITRPRNIKGKLLSNIFAYVPEWFMKLLPSNIPLDGEIYMGRGLFHKVSAISNMKYTTKNKTEMDKLWKGLKYIVYDIPILDRTFKDRYNMIKDIVDNDTIKRAICTRIENMEQLNKIYKKLLENGAEGVIIRNPDSLYEQKRSNNLLKMKMFNDDECKVVGHEISNNGKNRGLMGALICEYNKKRFKIGTGFTDKERKEKIEVGSIVNFRYMTLTREGIPREPSFRGIRTDV